MSQTLSGLFLVGAIHRPRKRKRTNRENPRTIPEQIRKISKKSGKSQKGRKRRKKEGQVQIGKPPRLKPPRLAALQSEKPRCPQNRVVQKIGGGGGWDMRESGTICPFAGFSPVLYSMFAVKIKRSVFECGRGQFGGSNRTIGGFRFPDPKTAQMPAKQGKNQQDRNWPHHRVWPQRRPKMTIKQGEQRPNNKWFHFHAPRVPPPTLKKSVLRIFKLILYCAFRNDYAISSNTINEM